MVYYSRISQNNVKYDILSIVAGEVIMFGGKFKLDIQQNRYYVHIPLYYINSVFIYMYPITLYIVC